MSNPFLIACICEGSAEKVIINKLLDADLLIFSRNDLLEHEVIMNRSPRDFEKKYLNKSFSRKIKVYRILDSRREEFNVRKIYKDKIEIINVITAPEIEVLVIIREGAYEDYLKYKNKSRLKPSEYCKSVLKIGYSKSEEFISHYFSDVTDLVSVIKEYRRLSCVKKKELCIADLLK